MVGVTPNQKEMSGERMEYDLMKMSCRPLPRQLRRRTARGLARAAIGALASAGAFALSGCGVGLNSTQAKDAGIYEYSMPAPGGGELWVSATAGEGRWRVIGVPGAPSGKNLWTRFLSATPDDIEFRVLERPGYNPGGNRNPVLDFETQITAILPLLRDKGCNLVMGQSYSAVLAVLAGIEYPERVQAIVILSGLVTGASAKTEGSIAFAKKWGIRRILPWKWKNAIAEYENWRRAAPEVWARLDALAAPVVIIHGAADERVPLSNAEYLRDALPAAAEAELIIVEGGDHYLDYNNPAEVLAAITRAIDKTEARGHCGTDADLRDRARENEGGRHG